MKLISLVKYLSKNNYMEKTLSVLDTEGQLQEVLAQII